MILVALGANLPDDAGRTPLQICSAAVERVVQRSGMPLVACSPWYRSSPVPPSGQPDYVNGVMHLAGSTEPRAFLRLLHGIEAESGRARSVPNAARTLDLDLLAVDDLLIAGPDLVLPHPRLHQRAFVLAPLQDVAPNWVHPATGVGVAALLAAADRTGLSPLA